MKKFYNVETMVEELKFIADRVVSADGEYEFRFIGFGIGECGSIIFKERNEIQITVLDLDDRYVHFYVPFNMLMKYPCVKMEYEGVTLIVANPENISIAGGENKHYLFSMNNYVQKVMEETVEKYDPDIEYSSAIIIHDKVLNYSEVDDYLITNRENIQSVTLDVEGVEIDNMEVDKFMKLIEILNKYDQATKLIIDIDGSEFSWYFSSNIEAELMSINIIDTVNFAEVKLDEISLEDFELLRGIIPYDIFDDDIMLTFNMIYT